MSSSSRRRRRRLVLIGANVVAVSALLYAGGWDIIQIYTGLGLGDRTGPPLEIVAHRGDLDHWPEDTLESISAAADLPVDGIEFDTVMSADGTWWVIHDARLDRTTDGEGFIPDLSDEVIEAARVDAGIGFEAARHTDVRVPTLVSVLDALAGYDGMIYVDLQHAPTGDAADVVGLLDGRRASILCRTLADCGEVKQLNPDIGTYIRPARGPADDSVDGWLMESFLEADAGAVEGSPLPVITFVDQGLAGMGEEGLIRRAWAIGVRAFLTKSPTDAIAVRTELMRGD